MVGQREMHCIYDRSLVIWYSAMLTHQGQLLPHQQRALRAITDAYLGELSATSPITIDNLDASPARPQHELLPDTDDDEGSHGEEGL